MTKEKQEKIKNIVIIVLVILVFFGAIYLVSENTGDRKNDKNPTTSQQEEKNPLLKDDEVILESEMSDLRSIGMSDLKGMLENNEKKVVMLGTDDCYWCVNQKPILQHIVFKYGVEINYLNLNAMTEEEYNELTILHDDLQRFGTPTFIIVDGGNITTVSEGGMPTDSMVQFLKDNGIITE